MNNGSRWTELWKDSTQFFITKAHTWNDSSYEHRQSTLEKMKPIEVFQHHKHNAQTMCHWNHNLTAEIYKNRKIKPNLHEKCRSLGVEICEIVKYFLF